MTTSLQDQMLSIGKNAREAARVLALVSPDDKQSALKSIGENIRSHRDNILAANSKDMAAAKDKGLTGAMLDRLELNPDRISAVTQSVFEIAHMTDPVGDIEKHWDRPNGLQFSKVRIPIGVIGMIYESRPNVTADAAALCLKSGNACILRGGSESFHSNQAIYTAMMAALQSSKLPAAAVQLIPTTDREAVGHLLGGLEGSVDMIIPRGGKSLIARVQSDARIPVLAHLEGLCHTYVNEDANLNMASEIVLNAKLRRTGVCGSTETLLVDESICAKFLPQIVELLVKNGCEIRGDQQSRTIVEGIAPASDNDYFTEHLAPILNLKVVSDIQEAISHINHYGSGHTDAIITDNMSLAAQFHRAVDSAIVMHNASTQFADGGEFGFGAEIGISTGRLHARGPVGAEHLTTYKYLVHGQGQTRPK